MISTTDGYGFARIRTLGMATDDARVKRVLKRYEKNAQFSDAHIDLEGISLESLNAAFRLPPEDEFQSPRKLDEYALSCFEQWMGISFDSGIYDFFVHPYARREFCSAERVPPRELNMPCEDGPPTRIPIARGHRWVSTRPKDPEDGEGNYRENYADIEDEHTDSDAQ